jgi:hypothetical protein
MNADNSAVTTGHSLTAVATNSSTVAGAACTPKRRCCVRSIAGSRTTHDDAVGATTTTTTISNTIASAATATATTEGAPDDAHVRFTSFKRVLTHVEQCSASDGPAAARAAERRRLRARVTE